MKVLPIQTYVHKTKSKLMGRKWMGGGGGGCPILGAHTSWSGSPLLLRAAAFCNSPTIPTSQIQSHWVIPSLRYPSPPACAHFSELISQALGQNLGAKCGQWSLGWQVSESHETNDLLTFWLYLTFRHTLTLESVLFYLHVFTFSLQVDH